jgi:hypothetical protein
MYIYIYYGRVGRQSARTPVGVCAGYEHSYFGRVGRRGGSGVWAASAERMCAYIYIHTYICIYIYKHSESAERTST